MRPLSSVWIWRKEIAWLSVALTSLIGMLTSPKEMAPFHIDRTCRTRPFPLAVVCLGLSSYDAYHRGGGATGGTEQSGEGALSGDRLHQGRAGALLRDHRRRAAAAPARPRGVLPALPGRTRGPGVLHQERAAGYARVGHDRRGAALVGGRSGPDGRRTGPAEPGVGGEPGHRVPHAPVAGAVPRRGRPAGLRPRSGVARDDRAVLRGRPVAARAARGGRHRGPPQDGRVQGAASAGGRARRLPGADQRVRQGARRGGGAGAAPAGGAPDGQEPAAGEGVRGLEPERGPQDHGRPLHRARPPHPAGLHPGDLGGSRRVPFAGPAGVPGRGHRPAPPRPRRPAGPAARPRPGRAPSLMVPRSCP
ncbi:hypothetical protein SGPA1_11794 [Streptomyces misionensis JCM 4497]